MVLLKKFISCNSISRSALKNDFVTFSKTDVRNAPKIANVALLGMSAAETWCVFRLLPFIIGDAMPQNDEY